MTFTNSKAALPIWSNSNSLLVEVQVDALKHSIATIILGSRPLSSQTFHPNGCLPHV